MKKKFGCFVKITFIVSLMHLYVIIKENESIFE